MTKLLNSIILLTLTAMWFFVFTWSPTQQLNYYKTHSNQNQLSSMGFNVNVGVSDKATATVQRPFVNKLKILPLKDKLFYGTITILFITNLAWRRKNEKTNWQKGWN